MYASQSAVWTWPGSVTYTNVFVDYCKTGIHLQQYKEWHYRCNKYCETHLRAQLRLEHSVITMLLKLAWKHIYTNKSHICTPDLIYQFKEIPAHHHVTLAWDVGNLGKCNAQFGLYSRWSWPSDFYYGWWKKFID